MKNNINKLNNILKKYHTIIIFILFVISLMLVSILNEESYINFLSFNNNNMEKIIKEEQDICSKKNVCGYVDGRNIPCPPTSCNDTCICRTK